MDTTLNGQPYDETDQQGEEAHVLEDQPDQLSAGGMHDDGRRPVSFYSQRRLRGGDHPRQEHDGQRDDADVHADNEPSHQRVGPAQVGWSASATRPSGNVS